MAFKPCELRSWTGAEWVCQAAGGLPLDALRSGTEPVESVCERCTVPEKLALRPCLFMVPGRVRYGGALHDFFGCRWYHSVSRLEGQRDTRLCVGCRDWFPRPPMEIQPNYPERTRRTLEFFSNALDGKYPSFLPPAPPPLTPRQEPWWRRLSRALFGRRVPSPMARP